MARVTRATAAEVRAFAKENGIEVGSRGRFSAALVKQFNKGRKPAAQYAEDAPSVRVVKVAAKDSRGRNRTAEVLVNPQEARAWAVAQGLTTQTKGRLSKTTVEAYALSTLS